MVRLTEKTDVYRAKTTKVNENVIRTKHFKAKLSEFNFTNFNRKIVYYFKKKYGWKKNIYFKQTIHVM